MKSSSPIQRIGILTGGGDCPGLNAVIRAITKTAINHFKLEVFGIQDGFLGLICNRMRELSTRDVANTLTQGGTILGCSNRADPTRYPVGRDENGEHVYENVYDRVHAHIRANHLDALLCAGGDGTMTGLAELARSGVRCMGVPKTIDNDLLHTEITFGFQTAVATATEAIDRIQTTAASHHRVMLVEIMGRNAGWLTLHSAVAGGADVILIPEIPYDLDAICEHCLERSTHGAAFTVIAVAEGAHPENGEQTVDRVVKDSPDPKRLGGISRVLAQQIEEKTALECRATILGHVQRGGTPVAEDRVLGTLLGHHALELLMSGCENRVVVVQQGELADVPLEAVAGGQRLVPADDPLIRAARDMGCSFG